MLAEHDVGRIVDAARAERPVVVIVDSIQTATIDELDGAAGSVGQVRESTLRLMDLAKGDGIAVVLVGHVTKDGAIAGPKTLEHLVDAVISLEGERYAAPAPPAGDQEPIRLDRRGRRLRDGRDRPRSRWPTRPVPSSPTTAVALRAASWRRPSKAAGRSSSRSRRWSARARYGTPSRRASGVDPNRSEPAHRRPRPAGRRRPGQPRRLRQPGRRAVRRGAGARSPAGARPCLVHARPADRARDGGHRRGRPAGRAPGGRRARASAARGRPARLPRAIVPGLDDRHARPAIDGLEVVRVATPARRRRRRPSPTVRRLVARRSRRC